jgi:DNA-binding NtrC family response regulator
MIVENDAQLFRKNPGLASEALAALEAYAWPGNVRELRNVIERAGILSPGGEIGPESLLFAGAPQQANPEMESATGNHSIAEMEKRLISKVLGNTSWRKTEAARILGINARRCTTRSANTNSRPAPDKRHLQHGGTENTEKHGEQIRILEFRENSSVIRTPCSLRVLRASVLKTAFRRRRSR